MLMIVLKVLSWICFLLGIYSDVFSLYCIVRVAINPRFRTSPIPFAGLIFYCLASGIGFAHRNVFLFFCSLDIIVVLLSFIVARRVLSSNKRKD